MRVEGENPLSPDLNGFGVWCSGTFWEEDTCCLLLHPAVWGPPWRGSSGAQHPRLGTQEALGPHVVRLAPSLVLFRYVPPSLTRNGVPSLVRGVWFPSHFTAGGASRIQIVGP
jgi:hypothetical protein